MAVWIMTDFLPLINTDKIYFYRISNITHETVNHAAAMATAEAECAEVAVMVVYSPPVAVMVVYSPPVAVMVVYSPPVAVMVVYSPPVAAAVADIHDCLYVCIGRANFL